MVALGVIIVVTIVLTLLGLSNVAWFVSFGGTVTVVFGGILWTAWRDPEKRYPGASFSQRLANLLTFKH